MAGCDSSAGRPVGDGNSWSRSTGSADSKRTSLCGDGRGDGVDDLRRITNSAVASGPSDTDVVVLVSQVALSDELCF